jgi:hypothetical protein
VVGHLKRLVIAAVVALASVLTVLGTASPASAAARDYLCQPSGKWHNFQVKVTYQTASNHRISIDRVDFHSPRNVNGPTVFYGVSLYLRNPDGSLYRPIGATGGGWNRPTASFWWNPKWVTATQAAPLTAEVRAEFRDGVGVSPETVVCNFKFWA